MLSTYLNEILSQIPLPVENFFYFECFWSILKKVKYLPIIIMLSAVSHQITFLLDDWSKGDELALEQLMPLVYDELREMARRHMRRQPSGHTFQTTELIHEAYLRIAKNDRQNWQNRAHFFGVAAQAMRHILVDYARSKQSQKRGGFLERVTLAENIPISDNQSKKIVALDEALNNLAALDRRKSRVVELKYFGGLTTEEIAEVLKISAETVTRDWRFARNWLSLELAQAE